MNKPSARMLGRATAMGKRAGETSRRTGIPEPCPFRQDTMEPLYAAWSEGYVETAHKKG